MTKPAAPDGSPRDSRPIAEQAPKHFSSQRHGTPLDQPDDDDKQMFERVPAGQEWGLERL